MAIYYLVRGNRIIVEIDTNAGVTALPLLAGENVMSLLNQAHIIALMNNTGLSVEQVIEKLGLIDERVQD